MYAPNCVLVDNLTWQRISRIQDSSVLKTLRTQHRASAQKSVYRLVPLFKRSLTSRLRQGSDLVKTKSHPPTLLLSGPQNDFEQFGRQSATLGLTSGERTEAGRRRNKKKQWTDFEILNNMRSQERDQNLLYAVSVRTPA